MDGHDYEYLVAKYLRGHGYTGVKVTKGSGDFGVDVTAHKAGHKYAVQCKYYTNPVSLGAIQEAVAGKALYNCDRAMVVTNNTFTKAARELANANNVLLLENVRSAGAFRFSQLPKGVRIFLLGAYLFTASALFVAMLDINKEQPFWTAVYNVVTTMTFMLLPLWIGPVIRGVKKLFRRALTGIKAELHRRLPQYRWHPHNRNDPALTLLRYSRSCLLKFRITKILLQTHWPGCPCLRPLRSNVTASAESTARTRYYAIFRSTGLFMRPKKTPMNGQKKPSCWAQKGVTGNRYVDRY